MVIIMLYMSHPDNDDVYNNLNLKIKSKYTNHTMITEMFCKTKKTFLK